MDDQDNTFGPGWLKDLRNIENASYTFMYAANLYIQTQIVAEIMSHNLSTLSHSTTNQPDAKRQKVQDSGSSSSQAQIGTSSDYRFGDVHKEFRDKFLVRVQDVSEQAHAHIDGKTHNFTIKPPTVEDFGHVMQGLQTVAQALDIAALTRVAPGETFQR